VRRLPLAFYARRTTTVARALLGQRLVSMVDGERCVARIVEVEAYLGPRDPASHSYRWHRSPRNDTMYGPPGRLYVYFTYGMHWCANVVTERDGYPAAVLLRAAEPLEGLDVMRRRRVGRPDAELLAGPARLAQALGITGDLDGHRLGRAPLWIAAGEPVPSARCECTVRVGVTLGAERRLRWYERGNPHVSKRRAEVPARRSLLGGSSGTTTGAT
jgi:DNA-3-methyladenine glycosylase